MKRKFLAMLGVLSVAAVLACGVVSVSPVLAQTASSANLPQARITPDPATALKLGPCRSGWWFDRGVWACEPPPTEPGGLCAG